MKKGKIISPSLFFLMICLIMLSVPVKAANTVQLTAKTAKCTMYTGTTKKFQMKKASLRKKKNVWTSSKKNVAVVNAKGVVTAKKPGKTVITCKVKGKKYRCTVTVKAQKMSSLKVSGKNLYVGGSCQLGVTIAPSNTYNKKLSYTSSNPSVISVSQNGTVKAVKAGSATITVKALDGSAKKAVCTIQAVKKLTKSSVRFVAHRGLSSVAPENTRKAFELAGQAGFWGAETDVRVTSDGEYILLHDATFQRMCGVNKKPEDMTLAEIQELTVTAGNGINTYKEDADATHICTLKEYLEICKSYGMVPVIELKLSCGSNPKFNGTTLQNTDDLDKSMDQTMQDIDNTVTAIMGSSSYVYISFDDGVITEMGKIRTSRKKTNVGLQLLTTLTASTDKTAKIEYCKTVGTDWNISYNASVKSAIDAAKKSNIDVNVWTVDNSYRAALLAYYGVDYITTNTILWQ